MVISLEVETGAQRGQRAFPQNDHVLCVGRGENADLAIPSDTLLSPEHFRLTREGQVCVLIDQNSRLGTFLNGQRVTRGEVHHGDIIQAGQTRFRVSLDSETSPVSTALSWQPLFRPHWVPLVASRLRDQPEPSYALLDAARDPHVLGLLIVEDLQYQSLYEGPKGEALADFAPYLAEMPSTPPLLDLLTREGWGKSWGVFLTCPVPFAEVRRHFRRFLLAQMPDGEEVLFRFYDPRVLRVFLPRCNAQEAAEFFGPVTSFLVEGEVPGTVLRFTFTGKGVDREVISFGPCVDAAPDLPWVQAVLEHCTDLPEEERLDLLHGWTEAIPRPGTPIGPR